MGNSSCREIDAMFDQIKKNIKGCPDCESTIKKLFEYYDTDKSGTINGFEVTYLIEDITTYVLRKSHCLNSKQVSFIKPILRAYINDMLDINRDGKISKEEFSYKITKCMNLSVR